MLKKQTAVTLMLLAFLVGMLIVSLPAQAGGAVQYAQPTPTYVVDEHFVDELSWCIDVDAHPLRDCLVMLAAGRTMGH